MKILLKLLISLVIFEIIIGYTFYIRDSTNLTGNYISSTLRVLDIIKRVVSDNKVSFNEEQSVDINCKEESNYNHVFQIADMKFYRMAPKFQTNIDFLNDTDLTEKYIIFIAGNSEAFGSDQNEQKRIHTTLQEKLKNKFASKDIVVVNISDSGFNLNDQFAAVTFFSKIFKPDLVIFYTGGNELIMTASYEDMIKGYSIVKIFGMTPKRFTQNPINLNIENEYWYSFFDKQYIKHNKCLEGKIFLTQHNFQADHASLDIQSYIKRGYNKINSYLNNRNIDFIFYIHPFNLAELHMNHADLKKKIIKLQDINIPDKRFINLSNENLNLDFTDAYHTRDSNLMANKIFNDILINYEQKIINKIN